MGDHLVAFGGFVLQPVHEGRIMRDRRLVVVVRDDQKGRAGRTYRSQVAEHFLHNRPCQGANIMNRNNERASLHLL